MSNEIRGKVSATYADEASAKKGATAVLDNAALQPDEVRIIGPHDTQFDQKLANQGKR